MNAVVALDDDDGATERWNGYLKSVAAGVSPTDALQLHGILWREIELTVLSSPAEAQRWREARLAGKSSKWSLLDRDEIFTRVARGVPVEKALVEVRGTDEEIGELYELIEALPDWGERYDAAMRAKGLRDMREIETIADDDSKDILETPKGPVPSMAAVSRSKLRVEARQWRLSRLDPERWGERKQNVAVQVNVNHAEGLEAARERARLRGRPKVTPQQLQNAVDATFSTPVAKPTRAELEAYIERKSAEHTVTRDADALREQAAKSAGEDKQLTADDLRARAVEDETIAASPRLSDFD